jgi:hypothetical protein
MNETALMLAKISICVIAARWCARGLVSDLHDFTVWIFARK